MQYTGGSNSRLLYSQICRKKTKCITSPPTLPHSHQVEPSWVTHYPAFEDPESGLKTSVVGLQFPLRPGLLVVGGGRAAMVKCTAAIEDKYWESSEVAVHSDTPHQASVMEGRAASPSPSHGWSPKPPDMHAGPVFPFISALPVDRYAR